MKLKETSFCIIYCPTKISLYQFLFVLRNYFIQFDLFFPSQLFLIKQVIFEVEIGNGYQGDIAIDDISFDGCSPYWGKFPDTIPTTVPPTTTSACSFGQFYCSKDSKCILSEQKCDFYKDCTDGQDEMHCGMQCKLHHGMQFSP